MSVALAAVAVAVGSAAQVVTGMGFSLVCAPFLVVAFGAGDGVRTANLLSIVLNVALLVRERRGVRLSEVGRLLLPAAVAAPAAAFVARDVDAGIRSITAGCLILVAVAMLVTGRRRPGTVEAGATSGAMAVLSGVGGPPIAVYALGREWPPEVARPTMQAYFLGLNVVSIASLGLPAEVPPALWGSIVVGLAVGAAVAGRLDAGAVRRAVLGVATAGGIAALARGFL